MKSFATFRKQLLKDKTVKKEYNKIEPEFRLIALLIEKRTKKGMTQATLAKKIGTKQSAVARLESGNYNPSLTFLKKVAKALDTDLVISLS